MLQRLLIALFLLLSAPLAAAALPDAHDHHAHAGHHATAPAAVAGQASGLPDAPATAAPAAAPGCHLTASHERSDGCGHTFTHACCAPAALVHVAALPDLRPAGRSALHGSWLRLSLAPRVQRIFHPPRQHS